MPDPIVTTSQCGDVTRLLAEVAAEEPGAMDRLMSAVSQELHSLAEWRLAWHRPGALLQTTDLVNEAYVRLFGRSDLPWADRRHFYFAAARAMRDIIVEQARRQRALKRGGDRRRAAMEPDDLAGPEPPGILDVDEALDGLKEHDERCADVVLLRFFGGYTHEEIARLMGLSVATARRDWAYARAWLRRRLEA